jgi:hypothetical protein
MVTWLVTNGGLTFVSSFERTPRIDSDRSETIETNNDSVEIQWFISTKSSLEILPALLQNFHLETDYRNKRKPNRNERSLEKPSTSLLRRRDHRKTAGLKWANRPLLLRWQASKKVCADNVRFECRGNIRSLGELWDHSLKCSYKT